MSRSKLETRWLGWLGVSRVVLACAFLPGLSLEGQPVVEPGAGGGELPTLSGVEVIGSEDAVWELPGSGSYVSPEDLGRYGHDDINRVLRQVPGVYVREEDGYGLFPNVSLRGVDTTRNTKLTVMEDGVLTSPAPYSAPAAYYTPTTGRMHAVEVLKGSSQVRYGPHTTGGAINYLSTPIPGSAEATGQLEFSTGSDDGLLTHDYVGQTVEMERGRLGYLFEFFHHRTDGFKEIDEVGNLTDGDATGFERSDWMVKLAWEPKWAARNRFEFKLGYTDLEADETYLGLTEADFDRDPYRRYAASRLDNFASNQTRTYLRHRVEIDPDSDLVTTIYYNKFHRNWYKLHQLRDIDTDGNGVPQGAEGLGRVGAGLSQSLGGAVGGMALDVLRGTRAGVLRVRANNRDYYLGGIQSEYTRRFETGELDHELVAGLRVHQDRIRRFQWNDDFLQDAAGNWTLPGGRGVKGGAGNRRQFTRATAVHAQDAITRGKLTVTPGVRVEYIDYETEDFNAGTGEFDGDLTVWAPGVGVTHRTSERMTTFGGLYRGVSVPGPRGHILNGLDEEESTSLEVGARWRGENGFYAEAVFFHTRFDDLIVPDNTNTGLTSPENAGEVRTTGLELAAGIDLGQVNGWGFGNPWTLAFTYTDAELDGDTNSTDPESLFAGGADGNDVPYIPELQLNLSAGLEFEDWRTYLTATWVDESCSSASNTSLQVNPNTAPPSGDSRFGKTDAYAVLDWSAAVDLTDELTLFTSVSNLLDEDYVASRHPHGPRSGAPRLWSLGARLRF